MTEQDQQAAHPTGAGGVPAPRGAVPDLGYFAGAPQPRDPGNFGGAPSPPAGPPSQFGGPAPSQFGAPAPSQFGGPPSGPPLPAPRATTQSGAGIRLARRLAVPIVVLVVLGALGMGRFSGLAGFFAGDLTTPDTLQGLPVAVEASDVAVAQQLESDIQARNPGDAVVVELYRAGIDGPLLFLVASRARADVDQELAEAGVPVGAAREIGDNTCGTAPDGLSICLHTSRSTTVIVGGALPLEQVAAATDEGWDAQ